MHDAPIAAPTIVSEAAGPAARPRFRVRDYCGSGAQFHVFDLRDGRVLKIPRSLPSRIGRLMLRRPPLTRTILGGIVFEARKQDQYIDVAFRDLGSILPEIDRRLIGNPAFFAGRCYSQDKAMPLRQAFAQTAEGGRRRLLDLYIDAVIESWRNGFCEISFDFLYNCGIDGDGRVIFLDLAGISVVQRRVLRFVARRDWLLTSSYIRLVRSSLDNAGHFIAATEKAFTAANLRALWGTAVAR
jgi:hypothetical protein